MIIGARRREGGKGKGKVEKSKWCGVVLAYCSGKIQSSQPV